MLMLENQNPPIVSVFNLATTDCITVRQIAEMAVEVVGARECGIQYSPEDRGWNGDVPVIRLDCSRLHGLGWRHKRTSEHAMQLALISLNQEYDANIPHSSGPH
jgi:nucleoside-diphosphate-sugar epimerase